MKTTQTTVVEVGDIIYVIDNYNKINKITLSENHLKQDNKQTFILTNPYYKLKTNKVKNGTLTLIKGEHHDDYDRWDPYRVVNEWYTYEKTDRVAYLDIKDAQNKVRELTSEDVVLSRVTEELFYKISKDVDSILEEVALYFETLDMNGLRDVAESTEIHQTIKCIDEKLKAYKIFKKGTKMKIVYHSFTGNCKRFAHALNPNALSTKELPTADEDIILIFPTVGFGQVPPVVKRYLQTNREHIKFVVSSGNRNWGPNFAKGADIITQHLGIPSYKIELAGTREDIENVKQQIAEL